MCRGKKHCDVLGLDPHNWNQYSPLPQLPWFEEELQKFIEAVDLFIAGKKDYSIEKLNTIRNDELKDWSIEHGQMSGMHRMNNLQKDKPTAIDISLRDPLRSPKKFEKVVFERDGHRCRYCGVKLVSNQFFSKFIKSFDNAFFRKGPTNLDTHGIIHIFNPVADHVIPWNLGGRTSPDNLVSSCGPCNYGKAGYTIEQIGIHNPLLRDPIVDNWDGLTSYLPKLKNL